MSRVVVEWTRTTLRVALMDARGARGDVRAVAVQPIGPSGDLAPALKSALKTLKVSSGSAIAVVSREQVLTRVVRFPSTQPLELVQMVELYAKAQLPYPREQTVMDFHVVSQQEGFSTVAIVACQRDIVDRYATILRETGMSVELLTVSSWGVLGWYAAVTRSVKLPALKEPSLIVNVDDTRIDIVLIGSGRILSSRSVGQGLQEWQAQGDVAELLVQEVERSRAAIRKELPGIEVRSLLLTGVGALTDWEGPLTQRLDLPVMVVNARQPFRKWTAPLANPVSPVVVGGLACSETAALLNLNPHELRQQVRHRQQVRELVTVSVLLAGVLAMGAAILAFRVARQRQRAVQLDAVLAQLEPSAKHVQDATHSTQLVRSVLNDRLRLARTLASIFQRTPMAVTLERLTFEASRTEFVVRGSAVSTQDVLGYIKSLEEIEGVSRVDLKYTTRRATPAGERTDFELLARVG